MNIDKNNCKIIVRIMEDWFEKFYIDKKNISEIIKDNNELRKVNISFIKQIGESIQFMNIFKTPSFNIENLKNIKKDSFMSGLNIIEEQVWIYSNYSNLSLELSNFYTVIKNIHTLLKDFYFSVYGDDEII